MKFSGRVGFWFEDIETSPGVYEPQIVEKSYCGDLLSNTRRNQNSSDQNDEFGISNKISILADLYMKKNWPFIKYVTMNGIKLKVKSGDINYPRITLELGGVWNESSYTEGNGDKSEDETGSS